MIDSTIIHKIHKAKEYASQPDRINFQEFKVNMVGNNKEHTVEYNNDYWSCTCRYFQHTKQTDENGCENGWCSHTMAMERVLGVMLPNNDMRIKSA